MRKTLILLAAGLSALAAPAAAMIVKIHNASPRALLVTLTGSKCVLPSAFGPMGMNAGDTMPVSFEVISTGSCAVYHSRVSLKLDLAGPGGVADTVSVAVQKPFSESNLEVSAQSAGAHGMRVQGSSDWSTATFEVTCPTCKPD